MTPSTATKTVKATVFDLKLFDDVKLTKQVTLPVKPTTIQEALEAVGNDSEALLSVIYDGLVERTVESAKNDLSTFQVVNEDGEAGENYTGTPVSEEKGKAINAAILGIAKAMGYEKSLPKEKKSALKDQAMNFMKSNPAMLESIQG